MTKYIFVLLLIAAAFSSCFLFEGERVRGDGNIVTEDRSITGFEGVESNDMFEVFITSGADNSVKVEADKNLMDYIETEVRGNVLRIKSADRYSLKPSKTIKVYLTAPTFSVIKVAGSGSITGQNEIVATERISVGTAGSGDIILEVKAPAVAIDIAGSGNITVKGETGTVNGTIAGSGDIRAADLRTRDASVDIAGSGSTSIHAEEKLDVSIAGSGDVKYKGNAKISSHIAGSGSISKID